jgi:hypothetical protein
MLQSFPISPAPAKALWILALIAVFLLGMLLLFAYFGFATRFTRFEVNGEGLAIRGTLYGRSIAWEELRIDSARVIDLSREPDLQPTMRTNGIGLPGYQAGWFRLRRAGKGLLFLTRPGEVLIVPTTRGYTLLLSAREPHALLAALRDRAPATRPA